MKKYKIDYPIDVLSYNIYFKAMLGIDKHFLPQKEAHKNVKKTIKDNTSSKFLIGLQEVQCLDNILPSNIKKKSNYTIQKSGKERMVTIWSDNFKLKKKKITSFSEGRPIQLSLFKDDNYILFINLHAPHENQNFGRYLGELKVDNEEYSNELIRILEVKIDKFLQNVDKKVKRIIILGDFNELFRNSDRYKFTLDVKEKLYTMRTDKNKVKSCCLPKKIQNPCDYIFDSNQKVNLFIENRRQPASDHFPVKTRLNF